jgi:uncharacterized RDD family membrane protein YckC
MIETNEGNPIPSFDLTIPRQHTFMLPRYAGFWRRFAAYLVDSCVVGAALGIPAYIFFFVCLFGSISTMGSHPDPEQLRPVFLRILQIYIVFLVVGVIACWLYYALMESSSKQGTLGKMAVGIVVTDLNGNRITFGKASGRFFGRILSALIMDVGFIMAAFTEKKQALHDMMAGTLVLEK